MLNHNPSLDKLLKQYQQVSSYLLLIMQKKMNPLYGPLVSGDSFISNFKVFFADTDHAVYLISKILQNLGVGMKLTRTK